jgi:hypothetical protein
VIEKLVNVSKKELAKLVEFKLRKTKNLKTSPNPFGPTTKKVTSTLSFFLFFLLSYLHYLPKLAKSA